MVLQLLERELEYVLKGKVRGRIEIIGERNGATIFDILGIRGGNDIRLPPDEKNDGSFRKNGLQPICQFTDIGTIVPPKVKTAKKTFIADKP